MCNALDAELDAEFDSHVIGNVPQDLVDSFVQDFPDQPKLHRAVQRGLCDHVYDILAKLGDFDEESGEYRKGAFNNAQLATIAWWNQLNWDVWQSR